MVSVRSKRISEKLGEPRARASEARNAKQELRVLQVFSALGVGGAEIWLMSLLRYFLEENDNLPSKVKFDILLTGGRKAVFDVEYRVKTTRLDDFLASRDLPCPAFVKLDTEGAEINILRGARMLLGSDATIVCELHPYAWKEFGTSFEELLELVGDSGKTIEYLDPLMSVENGAYYGAAVIRGS